MTLQELSKIIKIKRIEAGIAQNDLAKEFGVKNSQICNWESGKCQMMALTLVKYIQKFNLDLRKNHENNARTS